jgi:hypothetical protein
MTCANISIILQGKTITYSRKWPTLVAVTFSFMQCGGGQSKQVFKLAYIHYTRSLSHAKTGVQPLSNTDKIKS